MNDIDIKAVDSPKDRLVVAAESPLPENSGENEVDPLSIDEEMNSAKDSLDKHKTETEGEVGNCDDNTKAEVIVENELKEANEVKESRSKGIEIFLLYLHITINSARSLDSSIFLQRFKTWFQQFMG